MVYCICKGYGVTLRNFGIISGDIIVFYTKAYKM
jgi:hypothetical protein